MTQMNPYEENDINDLAAAFAAYRDRPRDVVPKQPYTGSNDDLHQLDGQTVAVTEIDDDGITVTSATITTPITGEQE